LLSTPPNGTSNFDIVTILAHIMCLDSLQHWA
jgi:hypothetical protein